MADRGIIFSAPMVRALLDGRKTQTRRILKLPKWAARPPEFEEDERGVAAIVEETGCFALLPTALIGDRLYVREANRLHDEHGSLIRRHVADGAKLQWGSREQAAWIEKYSREHCPSIHMPRWASRLTLTVTDVRVQRVQEISEADAIAEGVEPVDYDGRQQWLDYEEQKLAPAGSPAPAWTSHVDPRFSFRSLWRTLHTAEGERWQDNPLIVASTFDVARGNIDQLQVPA